MKTGRSKLAGDVVGKRALSRTEEEKDLRRS